MQNLDEECHKHTNCRKSGLIAVSDLKPVDRRLLSWHCGVIFSEKDKICCHHEKVYLTRFDCLQRICADTFVHHKKLITSSALHILLVILSIKDITRSS